MSAVNITTDLTVKVEKSVTNHCMGDEVRWDVSMMVGPDEQGQMEVGYVVILSMAGALLGSRMVQMIYLPMTHLEDEQGIDRGVGDAIEKMRAQRTQELQSPDLHGQSGVLTGSLS